MKVARWSGAEVSALREAMGYPETDGGRAAFAELFGVNWRTIYRWESVGVWWGKHVHKLDAYRSAHEAGRIRPFQAPRQNGKARKPSPAGSRAS